MRVPEAVRRRAADEHGLVVVMASFVMVGVLTVVAIVVDLGNLRSHRRSMQSVVDFAALAGAEKLAFADPRGACRDTVDYLKINANLPSSTSIPCDTLPAACDGATTPVTVDDGGTSEPYDVAITYPVSDTAIADPTVPGGLRKEDGTTCERIGVRVDRSTVGYFTGIVGVDSLSIHANAVARRLPVTESQIPNLWLLDPRGCPALSVEGGAQLTVGSPTIGGLITVDSDGSAGECAQPTGNGPSRYTIDASGTGTRVRAVPPGADPPGAISLVAMFPAQKRCDDPFPIGNRGACEQADVTDGRISPQPLRQPHRATRAIVDHMYDCKPSYPNYHGIRIVGCPQAGARPAFVTQLRAAMAGVPPAGFQVWSAAGHRCQNPTLPGPLAGNWWVDCPTGFKLTSGSVDFSGGNVVFTGGIDLSGGVVRFNSANPVASLPAGCRQAVTGCITASAASAAFVYVRSGNITSTAGSKLFASNTAVIQDGGYVDLAGGTEPVWSAPDEGPFEQLSLWSEATSSKYGINGGAGMDLEGVFFTPFANEFHLSGGGTLTPQRAQFVSYRLKISGGARLTLEPTGTERIRVPPPAALLIR